MYKVKAIADDYVKIFESIVPKEVYCYSPGIARLPNGRLIVTMDLGGPGVWKMPGSKSTDGKEESSVLGKVFVSDDGGVSWRNVCDFPFCHARPFVSGDSVYVLGHNGDLLIIGSEDNGETWTRPSKLTEGQTWHQAPCNVHYTDENVYLVMERIVYSDTRGWDVNAIAPVLMRGEIGAVLTKRDNWTFASELVFRDIIDNKELDYFGVPFYSTPEKSEAQVALGRWCSPMGWLETNVVQFLDPNHYWHDPKGKTFHLWARAHTGGTGYAAIAKVVENEDGSMTTMLETVPSGKRVLWLPCPGGQMKFHILYDEETKMFWLLSSQSTDSMTKAEKLPEDRYNLPNNERHRLQLHFSKNCIDWCFAGLVSIGSTPKQSRHYASMVIDGEDLHVVSRSGDKNAASAHNGNFISFHTIKHFRDLLY